MRQRQADMSHSINDIRPIGIDDCNDDDDDDDDDDDGDDNVV